VRIRNFQKNNWRSATSATGYSAIFYHSSYREGSHQAALKSSAIKCAWLIALLYMVIQVYVLHMNTHHIFTGTPPMCQICAALDNCGSAAISTNKMVSFIAQSIIPTFLLNEFVHHSFPTYRFPRAPPTLSTFRS